MRRLRVSLPGFRIMVTINEGSSMRVSVSTTKQGFGVCFSMMIVRNLHEKCWYLFHPTPIIYYSSHVADKKQP